MKLFDYLCISSRILRLQSPTENQPHRDRWTPTQRDTLLLSPINKYSVSALASHSQKTALSISPIVQKIFSLFWLPRYQLLRPPFKAFYCLAHSACPAPFPTTPFCKSFSAPVPSVCPLSPTFPHLHLFRYQPSFKSQLKSSLLANAFMPFQPEGSPSPLNVHVSFADCDSLIQFTLEQYRFELCRWLIHGSTYLQIFLQ